METPQEVHHLYSLSYSEQGSFLAAKMTIHAL